MVLLEMMDLIDPLLECPLSLEDLCDKHGLLAKAKKCNIVFPLV